MTDYFKLTLEYSDGVIQEWMFENSTDVPSTFLGDDVTRAIQDVEVMMEEQIEESVEDIEDSENKFLDTQEHRYNRRSEL